MKCKEYLCTSGILFGFKKAYGTELCIEIMLDYARDLRYQYIHAPLVKRVYAECSPLFQLIKLINSLKNNSNDTILEKLLKKVTHITVLLSMLQDLSSIHMILSVE